MHVYFGLMWRVLNGFKMSKYFGFLVVVFLHQYCHTFLFILLLYIMPNHWIQSFLRTPQVLLVIKQCTKLKIHSNKKRKTIVIIPWDCANFSSLQLSATPLATMAMMPMQAKHLHTVSMVTTASFNAVPSPLSQHVFCPLTAQSSPKWRTDFRSHGCFNSTGSWRFASQSQRWRTGCSETCTNGEHKYKEPPCWEKNNMLDEVNVKVPWLNGSYGQTYWL